jgi:hypothetical protein
MLPKGLGDASEDVDAIESEFFTYKGKAKMRQFLPNKVLDLYLGISYAMRSEIDNHIEESELNLLNANSVSVCYHIFTCVHPN